MVFDPLSVVSAISSVVQTGLNKFLPDKMDEADKAKLQASLQQYVMENALKEDSDFRNFVLQYEGKAEDVPKIIVLIRSLIRPGITIAVTGAYIHGWLNPLAFTVEQMMVLKPALLICLIFWFGDRALQKSGILDVLKGKKQ